jgi:hypothetical protein
MIVESTRGFGKVKNPLTGEQIDVEEPFETDRKTFEALRERYPGFEVVSEGDDPKGKTEESGEEEPEEFTCAGNDGECSRAVDEQGMRCWQHSPG